MPFFSIVIPVFRAEKYINRCLDSILQQTFSNFEVILIDDCGNDDSIAISQKYAKQDERIKILYNKKNLGAFHSRLQGMREAKGEYLLFIDSDDFISLDTCELVYQAILSESRDLKADGGGGQR